MKVVVVMSLILFSLIGYTQEVYGPMPALKELAPETPNMEAGNLDLQYDNWYQRLESGLLDKKQEEFEFNLRPHHNVTDRLRDNALKGDIKLDDELKNFDPTQLEGEVIIRY